MVRLRAKSDYESLRNARISENQARLASLGLNKTISDLREIAASARATPKRSYQKRVYDLTPSRRSERIKGIELDANAKHFPLRSSRRLRGSSSDQKPTKEAKVSSTEEDEESPWNGGEEKRPANAPFIQVRGRNLQLSAEAAARRCDSKGRGTVYDSVFGICCHFCRQKKLCGEEECKRCGNLDVDEPCLGKTDCSACHSSTGVFCRACLKVRYGEDIDEVRQNKGWMCPHCIEAKGIKPFWICNSSHCLKKRNMPPTRQSIHKARQMGYKSVAHLLMDELKRSNKFKR